MNQKDTLYINLIPESDKMVQLVCQETYRKLQLRAQKILISGRESTRKGRLYSLASTRLQYIVSSVDKYLTNALTLIIHLSECFNYYMTFALQVYRLMLVGFI